MCHINQRVLKSSSWSFDITMFSFFNFRRIQNISFPDRQTFTSQVGHAYSYIYIAPTSAEKQHLLLLHGFPSHIPDWTYQIQHFSNLGYGVIVPDLLGYGQSSKPNDINAYKLKAMGSEIIEMLDYLRLSKVIGVGHDWG
jgi:soluble epoxide hydrolase/lipid-phosphate phosphatase